jgi:hypothetical protein
MLSEAVRRISAVLLTLVLVLGPPAGGLHVSAMDAEMAVTALSDSHTPSNCDDCCGGKTSTPLSMCSATYCSGMTALPSSGGAEFHRLAVNARASYETHHLTGRTDAPDPYPPKFAILS